MTNSPNYERMYITAVEHLAEISDVVGVPEHEALTYNGPEDIIARIRALQAQVAVAPPSAEYVLQMLIAAGHVPQQTVDHARSIAIGLAPVGNVDDAVKQSIPPPDEARKAWHVVVSAGAHELVFLGCDGSYRGLINIDEYADIVRLAALHLNSFVGAAPQPGYYICDMRETPRGYALWWQANSRGYTNSLDAAGIYEGTPPRQHDNEDQVPVPVEFARALSFRRMIDVSDSGNQCLQNAAALRAAITKWERSRDFLPDDDATGEAP